MVTVQDCVTLDGVVVVLEGAAAVIVTVSVVVLVAAVFRVTVIVPVTAPWSTVTEVLALDSPGQTTTVGSGDGWVGTCEPVMLIW
jgi:hypothetical protein